MSPDKSSLESLVGFLSIGSLCFLGGFFLLDSVFGIYSVLDAYGGSPVWGILAALPTLVVAYVLGLIAVMAAELFFARFGSLHEARDGEKLVRLALLGNEALTQRYFELIRLQRFLEGSTLGFLILAVGALVQGFAVAGYLRLGIGIAAGSLSLAALSPLFAIAVARERRQLAEIADICAKKGRSRTIGRPRKRVTA